MAFTHWGERINQNREPALSGRDAELAIFRRLMSHAEARLWFVAGPPGVGKSRLGRALRREAGTQGWDCRLVALAAETAAENLDDIELELRTQPSLLILDGFEQARHLHDWLRDELLTALPDATRAVVLSREPIDPRWRGDCGWRPLIWVHDLGPAAVRRGRAPGRESGVRPRTRVSDATGWGGHAETGTALASDALALLRHGSKREREMIALAALNRFVTPALLDGRRDGDVARFDQLAGRPFFRSERHGVGLALAARQPVLEALRREFPRWTAELVEQSFNRTLGVLEQAESDHVRDAWLHNGVSLVAIDQLGEPPSATRIVPEVGPDIVELRKLAEVVSRCFGRSAGSLAARWLEAAPSGATVGRTRHGEPMSYCHFIDPLRSEPSLRRADPAIDAARRYVEHTGLEEASIVMVRFFCPVAGSFRLDNPATAYLMVELQRRLLFSGADIVMSVQPAWVLEQLAAWGRHPVVDSFEHSAATWLVCAYNLRERSPLQVIRERLAASWRPPPALGRAEWRRAVRKALKDYHHTPRLASGLLATQLGLGGGQREVAVAVRRFLDEGVAELGAAGADALHASLITVTFFGTPRKQRVIADELGMGFSTYRRHLSAAVDNLVGALEGKLAAGRTGGSWTAEEPHRQRALAEGAPVSESRAPWEPRSSQ